MAKRISSVVLILALVVAMVGIVSAQGSNGVVWSTIASGGGLVTGGAYKLNGSVAQPATSTLSGSTYTVDGGYWTGQAQESGSALYLPVVVR